MQSNINRTNRHKFLVLTLVATHLIPVLPAVVQPAIARPAVAQKPPLKLTAKGGSWVEVSVRTSKRQYNAGEPIQVTLKATNIQKNDAYLKFSSGQRFDFKVFKVGEKESVYVWSATRMFAMTTGIRKLKMAESETYSAEIGSEMGELKPGRYRLEAHLTNSSQIRALPIEFTIVSKAIVSKTAGSGVATIKEKRATLTAKTDKHIYQIGEEVKVDFSLQNNASQATTFNFRSGQNYDVFIKNAAGESVWNWSANIRFLMVSRPIKLAAGQRQDFAVQWNGQALPDRKISPGKYTVQAVYASQPPIYAAPIAIEIREANTVTTNSTATNTPPANSTAVSSTDIAPEKAEIITTKSGLKFQDLVVGTGDEAVSKQRVTVNYRGTLEDGTLFDQSYGRAPFSFILDGGQVIKGWDEGVQGMKIGGKRRLLIPSRLGYGETGTPGGPIPPNAALIFEVELLKVG